jgi:mRNA-degrading endonuclease RelE of RelBE toxin-antitoxin system
MGWETQIQSDVIKSLKRLSKEASKTIFLFLNEYLPADLEPAKLNEAKIKELKGIYLFPKETSDGMIHLFMRIDFTTKVIKVLHVNLRFKSIRKRKETKIDD